MNHITAAPTELPTVTPSNVPSSTLPSAHPSITGSVVFVDMNAEVTSSLSEDEILEIVSQVEGAFDVYPGSVVSDISYEIYGSVQLTFDDVYDEETLVENLEESIAEVLGVHASDVGVSFDRDTGIASYTISSETAEDATTLQSILKSSETTDSIATSISSAIPAVDTV